jgi:2-polyprenyl-6-methoxyphenol hydroxylase-like FAD-dependent oxidoreductase
MPPSGDGANLAMLDGAELGKAIAAHPGDVETALTAYEQALFARTEPLYAQAHGLLELLLGPSARFGSIDLLTAADQAE